MVTLAPTLDVHVIGTHEGVDLTIRTLLGIEGIAGFLGLVDTEFQSFYSTHPFLWIVGRIKNLFTFVVHIILVPRVTIHQWTGGKEQHARTNGERHDAVDTTIFRRIVIYSRQCHSSLQHLLITVVNHIVELRLTYHQICQIKIGGCNIIGLEGDTTMVFGQLPPAIGSEELHLVLHVVNLRLWQVVIRHRLYHIIKDVAMTDITGHHHPVITFPL